MDAGHYFLALLVMPEFAVIVWMTLRHVRRESSYACHQKKTALRHIKRRRMLAVGENL